MKKEKNPNQTWPTCQASEEPIYFFQRWQPGDGPQLGIDEKG